MAPVAILLGLTPPDPIEAARVPKRGRVLDFILEDRSLPADCVYVGRGHHTHLLKTTCWASPVVPGHGCSAEEWIAKYVDTFALKNICGTLFLLSVTKPWCDCHAEDLCEVDLLAGLVFEATSPSPHMPRSKRGKLLAANNAARSLVTALSSARGVTVSSCPMPPVWFSQEALVLAFNKLFPEPWFATFAFPMLEDLVNQPPSGFCLRTCEICSVILSLL